MALTKSGLGILLLVIIGGVLVGSMFFGFSPRLIGLGPTSVSSSLFYSPLAAAPIATPSAAPKTKPQVYGFLPYWNLKYLDTIDYSHLDDLAFFSVSVNADGSLDDHYLGYRRFTTNYQLLNQLASAHHFRLDLVLKSPDDQSLFALLNSPTAQDNLIQNLTVFINQYPVSGLNLDFEPLSATDSATTTGLTQLVKQLKIENSKLTISLDLYPSAAASQKLWDLAALEPFTDTFIIMTYDYYHPGSSQAGPVSPLYLAQPDDRHAVMVNLAQISRYLPASKTLLGIPFYGYEWPTQSADFLSSPSGSGGLASYARVQNLLRSDLSLVKNWSASTLTPWLSYQKGTRTYQIYYDDARSLGYKKQLVNDAGLGGYAIWALGYEGSYADIWQNLISQ